MSTQQLHDNHIRLFDNDETTTNESLCWGMISTSNEQCISIGTSIDHQVQKVCMSFRYKASIHS